MAGTREAIDAAHAELGTVAGHVPGVIPGQQDFNGGVARVETYPEEIRVDGTTQLSAFDMGGKRPGESTLALSGKATVDGALSKGEVVTGRFTAVVREVKQKDTADKDTGIVVSCKQHHVAQIVDLRLTHEQ